MNRPVHPEARDMWRKWYRATLQEIYKVHSESRLLITPDMAMEQLHSVLRDVFLALKNQEEENSVDNAKEAPRFVPPQFDFDAFEREAHRHAVDLYYRTYFPKSKGAPRLHENALEPLREMQREGFGYKKIADALGLTKDIVRDRLTGRKRRKEIGGKADD